MAGGGFSAGFSSGFNTGAAPISSLTPFLPGGPILVQQSKVVTPGHIAIWSTNGVIEDGGTIGAAQRVLGSLKSVNFNTTADQPITIPLRVTVFQLTSIIVTNASVNLTTAAGGFYPTTSKGGTAIVSNSQVYSSLTSSSLILNPTLAGAAANTRFSAANLSAIAGFLNIWFSLTTLQGAPATADIYLCGIDLS